MLMPDVTEILDDPDLGGGVSFPVTRKHIARTRGSYTTTTETFQATGNIQPMQKGFTQGENEDQMNEEIVIRSKFIFQIGSHNEADTIETDEITWHGYRWRLTRIEDYADWGFTVAYATRVRE